MNWKDIRQNFPITHDKTYLMNASIAGQHQSVIDMGQKWLNDISVNAALLEEKYFELVVESHDTASAFLNAPRESVTISANTGHNMGILAHLLKGYTPKRKILASKVEFPSSLIPYIHQGFEIDEVVAKNDLIDFEEFINRISTDHGAVIISHVQFQSGQRAPLTKISKRCKELDVPLIINGTQSIGAFDLNLKEIECFGYSASTHKWLGAGLGCSILYINPKNFKAKDLPFVGWTSVKEPWHLLNNDPDLRDEVNAAQTGTLPFVMIAMLVQAMKVVNEVGINNISQRIIDLSDILFEKLKELEFEIISNRDEEQKTGIINFQHPTLSSEDIVEKLKAKNVYINKRRTSLRASIHYFNNEEDIESLIEALDEVIKNPI